MANNTSAAKTVTPLESFMPYGAEDDRDSRNLWIAIGVAVLLHLIFFLVKFPEWRETIQAEEKKQKVYVVQQVRFKPPPPKQQREIPKKKAKKVPIPDPTPDEPEPIRTPDEMEPNLDIPDTDFDFEIPDGPPPAAEPEGPIMVGGDVKKPVRVHDPQPSYTELARRARIQGVVIVQAIIDKAGNVTAVKVLKGLPMGLDQATVDAIKRWRFKPATLNGKPVEVYYNLTVNFQLQ